MFVPCRNPNFLHLSYAYLSDPAHCPIPSDALELSTYLDKASPPPVDIAALFRQSVWWIAGSVALSAAIGVLFVSAFERAAGAATRATVYVQVLVPLAVGVSLLFGGASGAAGAALLAAAVAAWCMWLWRDQIELAARLLGVAGAGLRANPHLITSSLLLSLGATILGLPLLVSLALAASTGRVVPSREVVGVDPSKGVCLDAAGKETLCCAIAEPTWVSVYTPFALLVGLWTALLADQVRTFVVSAVVSLWYFAPAARGRASARGTTRWALKTALGPQLGSCSLGALVIALAETARNAADRAANGGQGGDDASGGGPGLLSVLLSCLVSCLAAGLEYLTRFATVFAAISGEALLTAGRHVTDLLARNFLDAFASTAWFAPMVVQLATLSLSLSWGFLAGGAYYLLHQAPTHPAAAQANSPMLASCLVGGLAGVAALLVLSYVGGVLLGVLDAVFVCWAIDKDRGEASAFEQVEEAFESLPLGRPVTLPDGSIAYGAPPPAQVHARV